MTKFGKPCALALGLVLAFLWSVSPGLAENETTETQTSSDSDMSIGEAADNLVEDSKKAGNKAAEIGSDVGDAVVDGANAAVEGVKDAADWTADKVQGATE